MFLRDEKSMEYGVTSVENLFVTEYLPQAKGEYVKVYLYALFLSQNGLADVQAEDIATAFGMERSEVEAALRFWERRRLMRMEKDDPPVYRLQSALRLAQESDTTLEVDQAFVAFSEDVYALFGDRRKLRSSEIAQAYEWVVDIGLPPETVLMLLSHAIATRGTQFSFKGLESEAARMKSMNVTSAEEAEEYFARSRLVQEGTRAVLRRLGRRRNPSQDEMDLYTKWTGEWGFAPDAVMEACRETTKGEPTFAYLDGILRGMRERGAFTGGVSASDAARQMENERAQGQAYHRFTGALGLRNPPETLRGVYQRLCEGRDEALVLLAAEEAGRGGQGIEGVEKMLAYFDRSLLSDPESARAHMQKIRSDNQTLAELYGLMGIRSAPTAKDRALLNKWQDWQLAAEMLSFAAELSQHKTQPMAYMDQILQTWRREGITTLQAARQAAEQKQKRTGTRNAAAAVPAQQYEQRQYGQDQLNDLADEALREARKKHE